MVFVRLAASSSIRFGVLLSFIAYYSSSSTSSKDLIVVYDYSFTFVHINCRHQSKSR